MDAQWGRIIFGPGERIFREGEPGTTAYLIEQGTVEISVLRNGRDLLIATLRDGELFGEMALIGQYPRSASAHALTHCTVVPLSRELLDSIGEKVDPLFSHLLKVVVERYREAHLFSLRESGQGSTPETSPRERPEVGDRALEDAVTSRIKLAQDLQVGIEAQEFVLHYQPIMDLASGRLAGFEALIRWQRPGRGTVPPGRFIPVAEQTGAITSIGRWVIGEATQALGVFQAEARRCNPASPPLFMSINLSVRQFRQVQELDAIIKLIQASGVAPKQIKLELTESMLMEDFDVALLALERFKHLGLQLAIDDFGTGYSSLSYLQRFPLDTLKIDRSFVVSMMENQESDRIVRAIASLAKDLGMNIVAEGMETEEQMARVKALGCEYGQGFLYSKPLDRDATLDFVQRQV